MTPSFSNKFWIFSTVTIISCAVLLCGCENKGLQVEIDGNKYNLEVAQTTAEKEKGLSKRESLKNNSGMIFLYDTAQTLSFWMKDTLIPLQIVFVNGCTIVDLQEMTVESNPAAPEKIYKSEVPADKAIELNKNSVREIKGLCK